MTIQFINYNVANFAAPLKICCSRPIGQFSITALAKIQFDGRAGATPMMQHLFCGILNT